MNHHRTVVCPSIVGRDDLRELTERRMVEVVRGDGHLLFIAGEAGIGKTRLLASIEQRAATLGMRSLRAGMLPSDVQVGAAAFLDLARAMGRDPDFAPFAARLRGHLATAEAVDAQAGDAHRRRRTLVHDLADSLADTAADGPVLLALEDLHWADDMTLEVLAVLARRLGDLPLLVIGTYRSDELYPRIPMRDWRARLVTGRLAEEIRLRRLQTEETATMIALITGAQGPVAQDIAAAVQARTDGIPLHVEEMLAVLTDDGLRRVDDIAAAGAPDTVEDMVMSRLEHRSPAASRVARAGAVIGRSFDVGLLAAVLDDQPERLSEPLRELADHHILVPSDVPGRVGFRHALICDAIYDHVPEPERRRLHERTADAARNRADVATDGFLSLHYERAGRSHEAFIAALTGARAAKHLLSHRDARELYARALRTMPSGLDPATHGRILEEYADTCAASDHNDDADQAYEAARRAYLQGGRPVDAAAVVVPHVAVRHLLGDDLEARTSRLHEALAEVAAATGSDGSVAGEGVRVKGRIQAGLGAAFMLDRRLDAAIAVAAEARTSAANSGDHATERHAATTLGVCYVFSGRMDDGWRLLDEVIESTRAAHLEVEAARAYRMIGSSASVLLDYPRATARLREGIEYAERVEAWNHRHYMSAHLAHVAWATGDWDLAERLAAASLADGRGGVTTRITALHVIGYLAMGRGQWSEARAALEEARKLGTRMNELQRWSPAVWGLAEVARLEGRFEEAVLLAEDGLAASASVEDAAYLFPYVVTGTRAHLGSGDPLAAQRWLAACEPLLVRRAIPGTLTALVHAQGLLDVASGATKRARDALARSANQWAASGRVWEANWARLDLARAHLRANQRAQATGLAREVRERALALGSSPLVAAADEMLAVGPRTALDPEPWSPLTAREFEVARLVADGLTNMAIAAELGVAPKTASAHVEHILAKLAMGRRAEIAAWVAGNPVLHSGPHGEDREE